METKRLLGFCYGIYHLIWDRDQRGFKRTSRLVLVISTISILALLVACSSSEKVSETVSSNEENVTETVGSVVDKKTTNKNTSDGMTIFHAESCEQIKPLISEYISELDFFEETSKVDPEGYYCNWMNPDRPLEWVVITGSYHNNSFMTEEELKAFPVFDVFPHDRVKAFGGVAIGMAFGDAGGTTAVGTKNFDISMTVGEDNMHLYGEPSIEVLLRFIEE